MKTDRSLVHVSPSLWRAALLTATAPAETPAKRADKAEILDFPGDETALSTHERLLRGLN